MPDIEALAAQLAQLQQQIQQTPMGANSPALATQLTQVLTQIKSAVQEAHKNLEAEAMALAASLKAKAAELRAKNARPRPEPAPLPHPWEEHQGLEAQKLKAMIDSLVQLGRTPPSGNRK